MHDTDDELTRVLCPWNGLEENIYTIYQLLRYLVVIPGQENVGGLEESSPGLRIDSLFGSDFP